MSEPGASDSVVIRQQPSASFTNEGDNVRITPHKPGVPVLERFSLERYPKVSGVSYHEDGCTIFFATPFDPTPFELRAWVHPETREDVAVEVEYEHPTATPSVRLRAKDKATGVGVLAPITFSFVRR